MVSNSAHGVMNIIPATEAHSVISRGVNGSFPCSNSDIPLVMYIEEVAHDKAARAIKIFPKLLE